MPTDTAQRYHSKQALNFALRLVAWSLGLFGLVRLGWFETHAVVPMTQLQGRFAEAVFGRPALPIDVTLACSGADAFALCAAAILAYPAIWPMRLAGAAGGIVLILILNTARIGTLGQAVATPALFQTLHVYIWPAVLTLAIAGYVFAWMRVADKSRTEIGASRRFVVLTATFLVLFTAASPLYLQSTSVLAVAAFIARAAAVALGFLGVPSVASANVLTTSRGAFLVTQECISTPLIPVYLAAVFSYVNTWRTRSLALLAIVPLFVALGITRLLMVALPPALIGSPLLLIHAFYQLLLAATVVFAIAFWRHGVGATAWRRAIVGTVAGGAVVYVLTPWYMHAVTLGSAFAGVAALDDPQGAIALLPAFQVGLYAALFAAAFVVVNVPLFVCGLALLGLSQVAVFAALHFVASHGGFAPHVREIRAWAIAAPLFLVITVMTYERPRR